MFEQKTNNYPNVTVNSQNACKTDFIDDGACVNENSSPVTENMI